MILDTSFIIDILRNDDLALKKLELLERSDEVISITVVTVFELWQGIAQLEFEKEKEVMETIKGLVILNLDFESAKEGSSIYAYLKGKGIMIDAEDCMIAGIAKVKKEKILTKNIRHFQRIEGVGVDTY